MAAQARVPVLIVSGFLGSGKTTLVRELLGDAQRSGVRAAVISNEFGELGIDEALLGSSAEAYVEIEGGCVCCKLSDELVDTLQLLWERVKPERVIVETSGVALPYDTQLNLWREPVRGWVGDDVSVVVVNAEQLEAGRELEGTFEDQVSSADLLLLNKVDLVEPARLEGLDRALSRLAPGTPVVQSAFGRVDPAVLFAPDAASLRARRRPGAAEHTHEHFSAEVVPVEPGVDPDALLERVRGAGALRAKGFVETSAGLRLLQGVGPRVELSDVDAPPPSELVGRLVLIRRA